MNLSPEQMTDYRQGAQRRRAQEEQNQRIRHHKGIQLAHVAAQHLKAVYHVQRVVLFGSFVHGRIHAQSDIDVAVWGLDPGLYWRAWGSLDRLSDEYCFDLAEIDQVDEVIRAAIEREGVEL